MASFITSHIVAGILECDPQAKQALGTRMATHLRLQGGSPGRDGGIDGFVAFGQDQIMFQCKLENETLGADKGEVAIAS